MVAKPRLMIGDIVPEELEALYEIESTSYGNPWPKDAFKRELKLPFSRILVARNNEPVGQTLRHAACVQCLHTSEDISQRSGFSPSSSARSGFRCSTNATCRHVFAPSSPVLSYD